MENKHRGCDTNRPQGRQLIITLSVPESALIKVEAVDKTGERHDVSEREYAALAGDYEVEDLHAPDELNYLSVLGAASSDFELDDDEEEFEDDMEPAVVRIPGSCRFIPPEARMAVLVHKLRQIFLIKRSQDHNLPRWVLTVRMSLH
ncbi:MAG TPA: hypothetical protein VFI23_12325 [Rhizomicrobium sp.]|nr:hypothetical protein [Rhizomicrobium sp.]